MTTPPGATAIANTNEHLDLEQPECYTHRTGMYSDGLFKEYARYLTTAAATPRGLLARVIGSPCSEDNDADVLIQMTVDTR